MGNPILVSVSDEERFLIKLKEFLGLKYREDIDKDFGYGIGWKCYNNDVYENRIESIPIISSLLKKFFLERLDVNKNEKIIKYLMKNFKPFYHAFKNHSSYKLDDTLHNEMDDISIDEINIFNVIPPTELIEIYNSFSKTNYNQCFKHASWTWITSFSMTMVMYIYH